MIMSSARVLACETLPPAEAGVARRWRLKPVEITIDEAIVSWTFGKSALHGYECGASLCAVMRCEPVRGDFPRLVVFLWYQSRLKLLCSELLGSVSFAQK
jgi:hypothetical protein